MPHAFGIPWADPSHLTFSFAPDGTNTPNGPSSLNGIVDSSADRREVLRAIQTWAAETNINIGLVSDGGQDLGSSGAVQGDARFGDIRIAGTHLASDVLASASPFSWTGTTFSGDVLFNADQTIGIGKTTTQYDLYSVALHEIGHTLGLEHNDVVGSVLNETYSTRAGLSAFDVAAIRSIYGVRSADSNEGSAGNDSFARATTLKLTGLLGRLASDGDLSTRTDADVYSFSTLPNFGLTNVTVRLQAEGLSLLTSRVSVYDAFGNLMARSTVTDPLNNDVQLTFRSGFLGGAYFVKVEGASNDVFDVGAYRLTVDTLNLTTPLPTVNALLAPVLDNGLNNTLNSATDLRGLTAVKTDQRFDATYRAAIETRNDVDVYKVVAPNTTNPVGLNVMVWATNSSKLDPRIRVSDANGNPVAYRALANENGLFSIEIASVNAGSVYFISVSSMDPNNSSATGSYFLGADFNSNTRTEFEGVATGTVASTPKSEIFQVSEGGIIQLGLAASGTANSSGVTMTVRDATGKVVLTIDSNSGKPLSTKTAYFAIGTYTITYSLRGTTTPVNFDLYLSRLSDDVGTYSTQTTKPSAGTNTPTSGGYSYGSSSSPRPTGQPYSF